jgi:hypothetical protein
MKRYEVKKGLRTWMVIAVPDEGPAKTIANRPTEELANQLANRLTNNIEQARIKKMQEDNIFGGDK